MPTAAGPEHAKFGYLLDLSRDQISALESDDLFAFDRILAAKKALVAGMKDAPGVLAADPTLASVVSRIQDADKMAQRLLYRKVGRIMREMNELNQCQRARGAYAARPARRPLGFLPDAPPPDAPRFFDVQS